MAGPWKGKEFGVPCVNQRFKLYHTKLHFRKLSSVTLENAEHINVSNHTTVLIEMYFLNSNMMEILMPRECGFYKSFEDMKRWVFKVYRHLSHYDILLNKCCIVMPAWTVLLFYFNHFYWCVLPFVYYCSCNSRPQVACHEKSFRVTTN